MLLVTGICPTEERSRPTVSRMEAQNDYAFNDRNVRIAPVGPCYSWNPHVRRLLFINYKVSEQQL